MDSRLPVPAYVVAEKCIYAFKHLRVDSTNTCNGKSMVFEKAITSLITR